MSCVMTQIFMLLYNKEIGMSKNVMPICRMRKSK